MWAYHISVWGSIKLNLSSFWAWPLSLQAEFSLLFMLKLSIEAWSSCVCVEEAPSSSSSHIVYSIEACHCGCALGLHFVSLFLPQAHYSLADLWAYVCVCVELQECYILLMNANVLICRLIWVSVEVNASILLLMGLIWVLIWVCVEAHWRKGIAQGPSGYTLTTTLSISH